MPDERSGPDWIRLDRLHADLGEDVGRFLDGPLDPPPRIRGLATIRNREPDQAVLDALDEREAHLEAVGEDPPHRAGREIPEKEWYLNGEPWDEVDRAGALESLSARREVAADGGEDRGE